MPFTDNTQRHGRERRKECHTLAAQRPLLSTTFAKACGDQGSDGDLSRTRDGRKASSTELSHGPLTGIRQRTARNARDTAKWPNARLSSTHTEYWSDCPSLPVLVGSTVHLIYRLHLLIKSASFNRRTGTSNYPLLTWSCGLSHCFVVQGERSHPAIIYRAEC